MKYPYLAHLKSGISISKMLPRISLLLLLALFFAGALHAQGACSGISFSFEHYEPCKFRAKYSSTSECFIEIRYILESGTFSSYSVNSAAGFTVQEISPSELWIHHNQGFVPLGNQVPLLFTLPHDLNTTMNIAYLDECAMVGCDLFGGIPIESCPDPQDASIIGVKYRECESLPSSNQPTLSGWTIQLLNADNSVIAEQVTDVDGAYAFYDLHSGSYTLKETPQPGWTPNVPASGQSTVVLSASEQEVRNFGNCPGCSCDSLYLKIGQNEGSSDTSVYNLTIINKAPECFEFIEIHVDTGQLVSWEPLLPGWTVALEAPNLIRLSPPGPQLPGGGMVPLDFRVTGGAGNHQISTTIYWTDSPNGGTCTKTFVHPSPPMPLAYDCCSVGSILGPELVAQGGFNCSLLYWPCCNYINYNLAAPGSSMPPGTISLCTILDLPFSSNQWGCQPKGNSLWNNILAVNGSTSPSAVAWEQSPQVAASTQYAFCVYANNIQKNDFSDPIVRLRILDNGNNVVFTTQMAVPEAGPWVKIGGLWTSPNTLNAPYRLQISSASTANQGNDFAIDCVSFRTCTPAPCEASFNAGPSDNCGIQFHSTSMNLPVGVQYCWDFDGNPSTCESTMQNPAWQPGSCSGTYNVCLTISGTGCSSSICQSVTFNDNMPPIARCRPGIGLDMGASCNFLVTPAFVDGGSSDNCQIQSMSVSPAVLASCTITTVTLTVTDWCNNTSTCTMGIQTAEGIPPVIICPQNIETDCQSNAIPTFTGTATATDNCDQTPTITYSDMVLTDINFPCDLLINRTWEAIDDCHNLSTCQQLILVSDHVPPVAVCALGFGVHLDPDCNYTVDPTIIDNGSSDNCQIQSVSVSPGALIGCGNHTITLTVTDWCGNTSTCSTEIQTIESAPPIITNCPLDQYVFTDPGQCYYTLGALPNLIATDNCDLNPIISCSWEDPTGVILPLTVPVQMPKGVNTLRCIATDYCGNASQSCQYNLSVGDFEKPHYTYCPPSFTVGAAPGAPGATAIWNPVTATDNCLMVTFNSTYQPGDFFPCGNTTVVHEIFDMTGNSGSNPYPCFMIVTVTCMVGSSEPGISAFQMRILPNPNPGKFTVELPEPAKPATSFRILDLTGRLIQEQKTEPGIAQQMVSAQALPAGLYFLQILSEGKVLAIEKFVKQ
jgi:hypothetical protein